MSGFAGIVRPGTSAGSDEIDRDALARMSRAIAFRGPDSQHQRLLPGAAFAFSFLQTGPAPQEPAQPVTLDGETWLLGDIRCDGRSELLAKLAQHGVQLSSQAASERLILHCLTRFGVSELPEIAGDLSLACWNQQTSTLNAFRDLSGSRPFFYSLHDGTFLFSNTMQALLALPCANRELDEEFLGDFLLGVPNQDLSRSVYRNIRLLPPGHLLEFSARGLFIRRIADMPVEEPLVLRRDEEYIEEFRRLFAQAVSDRLPETDTTVLLSGGLDSTSIAACAAALRKGASPSSGLKLRAYSVDSQPLYVDQETYLASRLAKMLGIPCQVGHFGDVLPFTSGEESQDPPLEPALDPYAMLCGRYYRQIARDSRVAFSGLGGDEVLLLQGLPYLCYIRKKQGNYAAFATLVRYISSRRKLPALGAGIRTSLHGMSGRNLYQPAFPPWLAPEFSRRLNLAARWQEITAPQTPVHPWNPVAYRHVNSGSVAPFLESCDATRTNCWLEARWPFTDRRLIRFLLRIPTIPWAMDKDLLRRAQFGILPDEIRLRKKLPLHSDDVLLHRASGAWNPVPSGPPPELLRSMVNWEQVVKCLGQTSGPELHLSLRPVALAHWLKSVENRRLFQ